MSLIQPGQPEQPEPTKIQVGVGAALVPGADGKPWVQVQIYVGGSLHAFAVPEATCEELGPVMAEKLAEAAAVCRRASMGLIMPDQMPQLPPINGARPA